MATKPKTSVKDDDTLASAARTSAQQIWQAGLGAFLKAQEEGGKVFSKLVREGSELQQRSGDGAADQAFGSVSALADEVSKHASGTWDKLEQVFEERVARALHKIGVPAQAEIAALTQRVDELSAKVAHLSAQVAPQANQPAPSGAVAASRARSTAQPAAPAGQPAMPAVKQAAKPRAKAASKPAAPKKPVKPAEK